MRDSLKNANSEAKSYRLKAKELQEKLDEIKKKEEESSKKILEEQGKFKELYEASNLEKQKLLDQINELTPIVEKFNEKLIKKKEQLLTKLPENLRDDFKDLEVEKIEKLIETLTITERDSQGVVGDKPKPKPEIRTSKFLVIK